MTTNEDKFVSNVERAIDDFVITRLMDKIDNLADRYEISPDRVVQLLRRVNDSLDLDDAWLEYVE